MPTASTATAAAGHREPPRPTGGRHRSRRQRHDRAAAARRRGLVPEVGRRHLVEGPAGVVEVEGIRHRGPPGGRAGAGGPACAARAPWPPSCRASAPRRASVAGHVAQDDAGPLLLGEVAQGGDQVEGRLRDRDADIGHLARRRRAAPPLELAGRDPEGRPPRPGGGIVDPVASPQQLGEGLGHRLVGHVGRPAVGEHRPPERRVDGLVGRPHPVHPRLDLHRRILHHPSRARSGAEV